MRKETIWRTVLRVSAWAAALGLGVWLLGPPLLPFLLGLVLARTVEPAVRLLDRRLPRWLASGCAVAGAYILLVAGGFLLCRVLCRELWSFLRSLPELAGTMSEPLTRLRDRLLLMAGRFPDGIGAALEQGVTGFFQSGAGLGQKLYDWAFRTVSRLLTQLPDLFLFLLTAVLSSVMFSAKLPRLLALWETHAPDHWQQRLTGLWQTVRRTLGAWLLAQGKLMLVTLLILAAGFLVLGVDYALLFALGIALLDALPVFGSGLILIPWSMVRFLQGDTFRGVGLLLVYGVAALTRTALEPRILGRQIGLDPLLTLAALYAGYRFLGIGGMILFPMGALVARQFWDGREKN